MDRLAEHLLGAIVDGRYLVGDHASNQLDRRGIVEWAVVAGSAEADWDDAVVRPASKPHATALIRILLPDGTPAIAVWCWLPIVERAKLVTVFFGD